jgi:hypothetical protein
MIQLVKQIWSWYLIGYIDYLINVYFCGQFLLIQFLQHYENIFCEIKNIWCQIFTIKYSK